MAPPSLTKLACVAMCKAATEGNLKLHLPLDKIPPGIRKAIWENCSLMEIIILSSAMNSTDFFSPIIRRKNISVTFFKFFEGTVSIDIICDEKSNLTWYIKFKRIPRVFTAHPDFMLKIGNAYYPTRMVLGIPPSEVFESVLPDHAQSNIANWVYWLFRKDIG